VMKVFTGAIDQIIIELELIITVNGINLRNVMICKNEIVPKVLK